MQKNLIWVCAHNTELLLLALKWDFILSFMVLLEVEAFKLWV